MKDIKYYVLWVKDNNMLKAYLNKYYTQLINKLEYIKNKWYLVDEINNLLTVKNKIFILNADYSSIINFLYSKIEFSEIDDIEFILNKFQQEISLFVQWDLTSLNINKWEFIWKTNIRLTTNDINPYNVLDAHPEHKETWGVLGWWNRNKKEWLNIYESTFKMLQVIDEGFYDELNKMITKIVPLWTSERLHNSASYMECVWHLYLWYTIDSPTPELNNIEALIHESSHNKLNLLFQFDKLILNWMEEKYYSPYRPDARHIKWVFLALHAFVPTIYVLLKAYKNWLIKDDFWLEKLTLYYLKNKITYKVIKKHWKLTELWNEILDEITYVLSLTDKMFKEININKSILKRSIDKQKEHFHSVNNLYPILEY